MNSLRRVDKLCHSISTTQANIFERSVEKGFSSFIFIKSFMLSDYAKNFDILNLESDGLTELEIICSLKKNIQTRNGIILSYPVMRFLGYFYRSASYLYNLSSKYLFKVMPPKKIVSSYETLHALPIEEAIKEMIELLNIKPETKEEKYIRLLKASRTREKK